MLQVGVGRENISVRTTKQRQKQYQQKGIQILLFKCPSLTIMNASKHILAEQVV